MIVHQSRTAALGRAYQCSAHPHFVVIFCEKFQAKPTLKSTILIHPKFFVSKAFKAVQSHSRIFRNIFLFLCVTSQTSFTHSAGMMAVMQSPIPTYLLLFQPFWPPRGEVFHGGRRHPFSILCQPMPTYASLPPTPCFFRQVAVRKDRLCVRSQNRPENQGIKPKSNRRAPKISILLPAFYDSDVPAFT